MYLFCTNKRLKLASQCMIALRVCQTGCCEKGREKSKGKHHYIEIHVRKRGKQERNHKSHVLILSKRCSVKIRNLF